MTLKKIPCLLALALFGASLQACRKEAAKRDNYAGAPAQSQASPQPDSQRPNEVVVPAPAEFKEVFVGTIDDKHAVRMELERNGANLGGRYFYERAGAFNLAMSMLELKGRIDGDGNVTLTETPEATYETGRWQKTGEFKGKLDGLSANGDVELRFSGLWTGAKDGKQLQFSLRQLRFDLGGLKLDEKKEKSANKRLRYEIETEMPQLVGRDASRTEPFNRAVADFVAAPISGFKKEMGERASEEKGVGREAKSTAPPNSIGVSYEVIAANKDFISILFYFSYEYAGAAHPNRGTESFNYDLNRNVAIKLADLFSPNSNYLKVISDYSIKELKKLETVSHAEEGAGPKLENFQSWNITPAGLKITFDPYQVGAYADGEHLVVVPYSLLKPIIKPDGLLAQFAK
jgi:hypothetical protein